MPNMFRNFTYPGSSFHEMNLDWLVAMCQKFIGLGLNVSGDKLRLVNQDGEVISSVTVSYAEKATTDKNGKDISTYIFSVAGVGDTVVFTHGDGTTTAVTVPYASKAKYDINGHELEDYIYNVQIAGDALRITHGDGTIVDLTIPYAVKASTDAEGKDLTTYAASLSVDGDNVVLRDSKGRLLNSITVAYATRALNDGNGDEIEASYGDKLQAGTTTVKLISKDGTQLSEITVPFATEASHATNADHATVATDATNAIESVSISGDNIVFTTYGGTAYSITSPYSVKAQKDDLGNAIKTTYIANVTNNSQTGALEFRDAMGNIVVSLLPAVDTAKNDTYGNLIADFVKTISVSSNSDYVTVTHGTGDVDTLTIHYAETAWKDTNGNVIKNTYIKRLACVEDVVDGHYKLVAYNGDNPEAELFRIEVYAYSAQTDVNGKALTSYVADVDYNASKEIEVTDGAGNTLKTLANKLNNIADVNAASPNNKELLKYSSSSQKWVPGIIGMRELGDVDMSSISDGDTLVYDQNMDQFVPGQAGGGGPANPVWTSQHSNYYANHQTATFGHIETIFAADQEEAEIVVGGHISVSGESWGEYSISDIYPSLVTINGVQGTMFTVGGPGLAISGDNTVVCDVNGNPLNYTQTLGGNTDCIAVTPARDAYMSPFNSMRSKPIIPLYCYIYNEYISGDHAIFPRVRCLIESSSVMTRSEIFQEITQGGYTVAPFYCYGKVALNYL